MTPPEIDADRTADNHWLTRVIPNKFPALQIEENVLRVSDAQGFQRMGGCGAHEVIIESPSHTTILAHQSIEQIERVLRMAQRRFLDLLRDKRFQAVIIFKNHGEGAGTSLAHPHWQVIATPVVPRTLRLKHFEAAQSFDRTGRCLYCVLLERELEAATRVVAANEDFVAICPYASHLPFETWIVPRYHQSSFGRVNGDHITALASLLKDVLFRLHLALDNPDFNLTIDTAPRGDEEEEYFLWHLRILPRLSTPAGFEMGSGMFINTVLPEEAANFLRTIETKTR
ncbi:MAG: galactose-1-phosphate uridylyltransferase [Planctomycetaceae bacterium]